VVIVADKAYLVAADAGDGAGYVPGKDKGG